jgi:hypothetical protein
VNAVNSGEVEAYSDPGKVNAVGIYLAQLTFSHNDLVKNEDDEQQEYLVCRRSTPGERLVPEYEQ